MTECNLQTCPHVRDLEAQVTELGIQLDARPISDARCASNHACLVRALADTHRHIRELATDHGYYSLAQIEADKRAAELTRALVAMAEARASMEVARVIASAPRRPEPASGDRLNADVGQEVDRAD